MAVYDCSMFFNENDIFEIRLNQHWDFVDKFVVVEAGETHTGLKKPLNFDHERFKPYADKIIYRSFDSFDEAMAQHPEYFDKLDAAIHDFGGAWIRDNFQGNYIFEVLKEIGARDDDIILHTPPDEIIKRSAMMEALERFKDPATYDVTDASGRVSVTGTRPIFYFMLRMYVYKFNLLAFDSIEQGSISEFGNHKKIFPSLARACSLRTHPPIENAGWHFSYADNTSGERVLQKMKSWAHAGDPGKGVNGARRMDSTTTTDALTILQNEFNLRLSPIDPATHPEYVVNNIDKFQDYIYQP